MRLDQGSLIFTPQTGECPSWETALGQSHEGNNFLPPYHFKADGYENILIGMMFNSIPLSKTSCILGKKKFYVLGNESYKHVENQEIQLASKFDNIVIHYKHQEKQFDRYPIILLLTKIQDNSKFHLGRRSIKYSPHTTYDESIKNQDSFENIQKHFENRLTCYGFFVEHFDTLHLYCVDVDISSSKDEWKHFTLPKIEWSDWVERETSERKASTISLKNNDKNKLTSIPTLPPPTQTIYYGVPGCGKSHTVDKEINAQISAYNADKNEADKTTYEKQVIRTVFHPDYCNADFIGQIVPQKSHEGENKYGIKYEFKPGPLATILRKAYLNPGKPYFLVIEEINRGNAAAIFGETFQLLDRYQKNEHSKSEEIQNEDFDYTEGWSKYSVNNDEMNEFILKGGESNVVEKEPGVEYDSDFPEGGKAAIKIPSIGLHFSTYCGIRLPPNLSFYATMNTSDQNVFTLDNAFQRRWEMKLVPNGLNDSAEQYNRIIKNGVKWGEFRERINEIIMEAAIENGLSSMEDKRLGGWFYTKSDNFAEKVLKYLWDDAFKFDRTSQFGDVKTLEELIENFNEKGFAVFKADSISSLQNNGAVTDE